MFTRSKMVRLLAFRTMIATFAVIPCSSRISTSVKSDETSQLKRLVLDAQAENFAKFESGQMHALVIRGMKGQSSANMDVKVQWDASTRYWAYRVHDPDGLFQGKAGYTSPVEEAPIQHVLQTKDRLVITRAIANYVLIQNGLEPGRPYAGHLFFEITPDPLWKNCCLPYVLEGRPWKETLEMSFANPDDVAEVRFEQLEQGIVRMTVKTREGKDICTTECDFSLPLAGSLVRYDSHTTGNPDKVWSISNDWINEGGAVRLVRSKMLMGGKDEATAKQSLEIVVRSMRPGTGKVQMTLEKIVAMMPKNARVVDQIRDKSYPVDPRAKGTIADLQLKKLADEVKKGEFLNR